ncbi:uncharacterized protein CCDC7 [Ranitomeya variabilis]|uniref:uncharacterized protein CCDC7 n=1 Tax=Ranitomeya variabilis TaxID=490064 RepID=UPI0040569E41
MATTATIKFLNNSKPKPSFTPKTAHLNPIKRNMLKTAAEEFLPMVQQPPPEAESIQQHAISLTGSGKMGDSDDSVNEMRQTCKNLDKYTKDLENVYEKSNEQGTAQTSPMERQFSSFLSTCDSATRELDATINEKHEILESLYQDYQQEAQLLEELGEEDITAERDVLASHDKLTALICKLMEVLYKHSFKNVPKIGKTRGGAQIQGPDLKFDHSQQIESLIRSLRELLANTDIHSKEEMESIIHDVGQLFATQAIELHKLGKDQEETENKYIKVKTNYQVLLQEKRFLETELRKLLTWRGEGAPPADSLVSSLHKKPKIQKEGDIGFSEIEYTYDLDQGDLGASTTTEPRDDYMVDTKISGGPESKDQFLSLNPKEETTGKEKEVTIKKQKLKSWKRKGRRPNAVSSKEKMADQEDSKSSKTTIKRLEDKAENKIMQQVPEMVYNLKKSATKLQRTLPSSGKGRAQLNEGDDMTAIEPSAQTQRDKEQGRPSGPEPSKSVGKQLGRRQSLLSKSRHRSEEKLESDKQSQKDPPVKLQIKENQHEKQIANEEVRDNSFQDPSVVNTEGNRVFFSGPDLSRTTSPDQEGLSKDVLEPDIKDKRVRSSTEDMDAMTQDSGAVYSTEDGQVLEDTLSPDEVSQKTLLSPDSEFTQTDHSDDPQRSPPCLAAASPYPPPTVQIQPPEDTDDTTSRFHTSKKMPDKADKETARSGNQLDPAMMVCTMFGDDPWMQHRESAWKYGAAGVVLSIGPQKEISKFQQDQVWKDLDDEFHEFPQSFEPELCIQGISFKHSTENSPRSPSQSHNKQRGERRKPLYIRRVTRNVPSEQSILSTLTVKGIGRGATSTLTPSEKLNSSTLKGEEPQNNPDQTAKPMGDAAAPDFCK